MTRLRDVRIETWATALSLMLLYVFSIDYRAQLGQIEYTVLRANEYDVYFWGGLLIWLVLSLACVGFALAWNYVNLRQVRYLGAIMITAVWLLVMLFISAYLSVALLPVTLMMEGAVMHLAMIAGVSLAVYGALYPDDAISEAWIQGLTLVTLIVSAGCVGNIAIQYVFWFT